MAIPRNLANIAPHVNASSTELVVNDGGANLDFRVEGDTNANLLVADAGAEKVGFGTNTFNTNGGVIQVSNGISFPATQSASTDANTLDDYEEGTWTPTVGGALTTGTYTINGSTLKAYYTKIGNQVTCYAYIEFTAASGGAGYIVFGGFPFNYKSGSAVAGTLIDSNLNITTASPTGIAIAPTSGASSAATFLAFITADDTARGAIAIGAVQASTIFQFTVTYTVS